MVTVHIWDFLGKSIAWGHASMHCGTTYISWWPVGEGRVPSKMNESIYDASPFRNQTYETDQLFEGNGKYQKMPDHNIELPGLDEAAINDWWAGFGLVRNGVELQGPLISWSSLSRNCSTVVAQALTIGGGGKYASLYSSHSIIWTPNNVKDYALSIKKGIANKK